MQKIDRRDELLVILGVRRDIGLRALLLVVAVLQMALERGFALRIVLALQIVRHILEDLDVGIDALGLNRAAGWRVVTRRGQPQCAILAERDDRLHRALAEGARADQRRALMILQGAGDDFGGRGGAAVNQHDHRLAMREIGAGPRAVALRLFDVAPARRDDLAAIDESIDDFDRLIEQAAWIVAQIENVAFEIAVAGRVVELRHGGLESLVGLLGELGDSDVADVAALDMRTYRLDLDHVAGDLDIHRLFLRPAHDLQLNRRIDRAAHLVDRLIEGHALNLLVIDGGDDVAGKYAGLGGGGVVDRRDDLDQAVLLGDLDAKAAEFALGLNLHLTEALGVHVARMRIERGQHAVDRGFHEFAFVGLLDIVAANFLEDIAKQIQLAIGVGRRGESGAMGEE